MAQGSRLCPSCGRLNSAGEARCFYCNKRLPGPALATLLDAYRSVFGGELAMTRILIGMNVVVFGLCVALDQRLPLASGLLGSLDESRFRWSTLLRLGALPGELLIGPMQVEPWRYLSAVFLHGSVLHLVFNMLAIASFGGVLERQLGSARYAVLFFATGILGFMVSDYWAADYPLTVGASGSAFGLLGARVGVLYARRDPGWKDELIRNAVLAAVLALAMRVNTAAHLGGAAAGVVLGLLFEKEPRRARLTPLFAVIAVIGLLSSVASIVLSNKSPLWREVRDLEMNVYQQ
jgi:membrane associated rhomboid family serine protease